MQHFVTKNTTTQIYRNPALSVHMVNRSRLMSLEYGLLRKFLTKQRTEGQLSYPRNSLEKYKFWNELLIELHPEAKMGNFPFWEKGAELE